MIEVVSAPRGLPVVIDEPEEFVPANVPQAGLFAHHFPCLASMHLEPAGDTLMHVSGYVVNDEVERELRPWCNA